MDDKIILIFLGVLLVVCVNHVAGEEKCKCAGLEVCPEDSPFLFPAKPLDGRCSSGEACDKMCCCQRTKT